MSFAELAKQAVARKKIPVPIKMPDGSELVFHANEISYIERVGLGVSSLVNGDLNIKLLALSITDPEGKRMTVEQAQNLSDEHQEVFYRAALEANKDESTPKDSKKKARPDPNSAG